MNGFSLTGLEGVRVERLLEFPACIKEGCCYCLNIFIKNNSVLSATCLEDVALVCHTLESVLNLFVVKTIEVYASTLVEKDVGGAGYDLRLVHH